MATVAGSPPLLFASMASSKAALVTKAKNALATVMLYSVAFAVYFEAVNVRVTGSSIGK